MAAAFAPTPGEVRWQRIGGVAPPADADVDSDHAHSAQAPHGPPDNPTSAEPGSPAAGREDALHAWYGDTLGRVHGQMSAELERLRDELARVKVSHDQHDRRVQERSAEQLAVCHCDAFATLEAVLDPIPPLLHRLRGELELDSQHAEERREQMDEMMQGAEFARPPTGSAQSDELGADAEWREWLGGLRRVATVHAEGSAASRAALDESLRAAERALASATMDASAQARALLAVVTSFPADQASLAPLYAAATAARAERAHWEKTARELDEQLRRTERQVRARRRLGVPWAGAVRSALKADDARPSARATDTELPPSHHPGGAGCACLGRGAARAPFCNGSLRTLVANSRRAQTRRG